MFTERITAKKAVSVFLTVCLMLTIALSVALPVSADDGETTNGIDVSINYVAEKIVFGDNYASEEGGKPIYMYSPNASITASPKKEAAEKWYPVYGNSVNVSKYIPSSPEKESIIAVRLAADLPGEDGTYESRDIVIISGRPQVSASDMKRKLVYNPLAEKIEIDDYFKTMGYDYQVDLSEWNYNMTTDLDVSAKFMPLGGVVTIRQSANQASGMFASVSIKVKVPKAASSPNLKINMATQRIIGISKNVGWSTAEDAPYKEFNDTFVEFNLFEAKVTSIDKFDTAFVTSSDGEETECIVVYVKTLATDRKPSSPVKVLYIPVELLEEQIKGENTEEQSQEESQEESQEQS